MQRKVEVLIIGSGFGGAIAARRLAEAGRDVLVLERGPWRDTVPNRSLGLKNLVPLPQGAKAYTHGLRCIGSHRLKHDIVLNKKGFIEAYQGDGINVICSSGVGGGSHVYAGFMDRPLVPGYWDHRHPELCSADMERYYEELLATYNARPLTPADQVPNSIEQTNYDGTLNCLGHPSVAFLMPENPGQPCKRVDGNGMERWECDMKNNSFLGSPSGAKTTLDFSTIWPAMQNGLKIKALCEVTAIRRMNRPTVDGMRYEVSYRDHSNNSQDSVQAEHVILAAGGLGSVRLLLKSRDVLQGLQGMPQLGKRFGGNGDYFGLWKENSRKDLSKGMPIGSPFRLKDSKNNVLVLRASIQGIDAIPMPPLLKGWLRKQSVIIAFGGDNNTGTMAMHKGRFRITYKTSENPIYQQIGDEMTNIQRATGTKVYAPRNPVTVHPVGGACLGASIADGVVGANGEVFDNPGLFVADAAALPASPGGAPSLTIAAWSANVADRLIASLKARDEKAAASCHSASTTAV